MRILLRSFIKLDGSILKYSLDKTTKAPRVAQNKYLLNILKNNENTEYGNKYNFDKIHNEKDYEKHIPINKYKDLEPYVGKIINGKKNILTTDTPIMFNLTSGTSDKPKYIPFTIKTKKRTASLMHQWFYRALLSHPSILDKYNFTVTSSATEGYTASGIPYGSVSGLIYKNMPSSIIRSYVLPFIVTDITNYDLRYYTMARLALEKDISFIATPNPTTLIKVADIGVQYQEEIIRSIHDGCLFTGLNFDINNEDLRVIELINASLKHNHSRAQFLSDVLKYNGSLLPCNCWPSLKLIGCWLGGSIGYHAEKLANYYGDIPKRDLGYLASEGCITLPYEDSTPSGILALQNNYYEFIPEELASSNNPQVLLSHELEIGKCYKILLTNESGLYRYDINDTIKVEKFYNQTPVLSFVRKTNDILNITGEKLHINHIIMTFQKIKTKYNLLINQFRVVSNQSQVRYDIFLALGQEVSSELLKTAILPAIDSCLSEINIEYSQKRKSKRLNPPCLHIMDSDWEENIKRKFIESGKRDIQYKWNTISHGFLDIDKKHVKFSINYKE